MGFRKVISSFGRILAGQRAMIGDLDRPVPPREQVGTLQFRNLVWETDHRLRVGDACFELSTSSYTARTTDEVIVLLKTRGMVEWYRKLLEGSNTRNILEFGTWEGGSPLFFGTATSVAKFVGIDLRGESAAIDRQIAKNGVSNRVRIFHRTSQSDRAAVSKIIDQQFSEPLDVVIDDASHQYVHTKAAFEIAFPRLRVGGLYIIEDWNWAHYENFRCQEEWRQDPALSNLVLELTLALGSHCRSIGLIEIGPWYVVVRKMAETPANFRLDDVIRLGTRSFVKI
jgi:3-dehydroquinate dehydratase